MNSKFIFYQIQSNSIDDVHKAMKYGIWTSAKNVNETLINAFNQKKETPDLILLLLFKIKGQSCYVGCAELISDYIRE